MLAARAPQAKRVFKLSNKEIHVWFEHVLKLKMSPELFTRCCIPNVLDLNDHFADVFRSQKNNIYLLIILSY